MVDEFKPDQDMFDRYVQGQLRGKDLDRVERWLSRMDQFKPDRDMIDSYVQGRLRGAELERMELWVLKNPHRLDELRLADALRRGIKQIRPDTGRGRNGVAVPGFLGWLARPALATVAAALALAVLIAPSWAYFDTRSSLQEARAAYDELARPTLSLIYPIERTRSATGRDPDIVVTLTTRPYTVVLQLPIPAELRPHDRFDVTIRPAGEKPEKIPGEPVVNTAGKILLTLHTLTLSPGLLEVEISGDEGKLATYRIGVQEQQ